MTSQKPSKDEEKGRILPFRPRAPRSWNAQLRLRDQILTLVRLNSIRGIHSVEAPNAKRKKSFVIVIGIAEKRFGLLVDTMVGEEELVIKALPGEIVSSDLVSGASILGDGTVVLILNVPAILSRLSRSIPLGAIA